MKKLLLLILVASNVLGIPDYINKYFPENSIIRQKHNSEKRGTGWFGFNSSIRRACDDLNNVFSKLDTRPGLHPLEAQWFLESDLKTILVNENETTRKKELELVLELRNYLIEKVDREAEAIEENKERTQRLDAIRRIFKEREQRN